MDAVRRRFETERVFFRHLPAMPYAAEISPIRETFFGFFAKMCLTFRRNGLY
jgi:hypothetical protein